MKKFVLSHLKYIILVVVFLAAVITVGILNINAVVDTENRKSSYTRTQFDYFISSPDKNQVESIEQAQAVDKVFPYYALSKAFTESSAQKEIYLLLSDDMADYDISLFTEKTCISGSYNVDGAMLDNLAAEKLGVKVGDSITFKVLGRSFTKPVSAIYLTSTYGTLTKGIVLVNFSDDIKEVYQPKAYSAAFVTASDKEGVKTLLTDYVGEGNVTLSYDAYVESNCGTKPPYQSQEDFDKECQEKYEEYRTSVLDSAKKGGAQVAAKADSYDLIRNRIDSEEKKINNTTLLTSISILILFAIVNTIFVVTNRSNDRIRCDEGMSFMGMFGDYALSSLISAAVISLLSFGVLYAVAMKTFFLEACISMILYLSLSVLVSFVVVALVSFICVKTLYSNSVD